MKTYKDFRVELEEKSLIATAVDKYREMRDRKAKTTSGDNLDDDMKLDKPTSLQNQNVQRDAKKKPPQPPPVTDKVTEEKEANAENCSDLPPDEKKKERRMDIEKINKKIKPHHKKISAKK